MRAAPWPVFSLLLPLAIPATPLAGQDSPPAATVYTVDNAHSIVDFTVRLVGFNRVRGNFQNYRADLYYDPADLAHSTVAFAAEVRSIKTENEERDADLQGATFFDAEHYPYLTFESERVEPSSEGFTVVGRLSIKDVVREVRLPVRVLFPLGVDPFGNPRIAFGAALTINRKDFHVTGPRFWEKAISDSVSIEIEASARRWNYDALGWGNPARPSAGRLLYEAADSGRLDGALTRVRERWRSRDRDSTMNFSVWEFEKAALRLVQHDRAGEALKVLQLAEELERGSLAPGQLSRLLSLLGETRYRLNDWSGARTSLDEALRLDSTNTYARQWKLLTDRGPKRTG